MSRYAVTDSRGRKFVYGFDRPLSYYFLSYEGRLHVIHLVGLLSPVYGSAANLLEWIDRYRLPIPEEHRLLAESDLPF